MPPQVGFTDPRCLSGEPISIDDPELKAVAGDAQFYSLTFRCGGVGGRELMPLAGDAQSCSLTFRCGGVGI